MNRRPTRRLMRYKIVRRITFIVVRWQAKKRGRKYVKIGIVVTVVGAAVGVYLASRRPLRSARSNLSPASQ